MPVSRGYLTADEIDDARGEIESLIAAALECNVIADLDYDDEAILDLARSDAKSIKPEVKVLLLAWIGLVDLGCWQDEHREEIEARR